MDLFVGDNAMVHVVGDLHGHLHDFLDIVDKLGWPGGEQYYISNGYFVDKGSWTCEVVFILFAMKLSWPEHVILLRSNHEYQSLMKRYGYKGEVHAKYGADLWDPFWKSVSWCPIIAVVSTFVYGRGEQVPAWVRSLSSGSTGQVPKALASAE